MTPARKQVLLLLAATTLATALATSVNHITPTSSVQYFEDFNASGNWTWASSYIFLNTSASSAQYNIDGNFRKAWENFTYTSQEGTVYEFENNFTYHSDGGTTEGIMFGFVDDFSQGEDISWISSNMVAMRVNNHINAPLNYAAAYFIVRKNGTTLYSSPYPSISGYGLYHYRVHVLNETHFNVTIWKNGVVVNTTLVNNSAAGITTSKVAIYTVDVNPYNSIAGTYRGFVDYFKIEDSGTATTTSTSTTIPAISSTSSTTTSTTTSSSTTSTTTLISGGDVYASTYFTLRNARVLVYAVVRNGTSLGDVGSDLEVTVDGSPFTLFDTGDYGDFYAGDGVYSNWYTPTQNKTYSVTLSFGGKTNSTQFKVVDNAYLIVVTDYLRLYNEFLDTGAGRTQDLNNDSIPDFYNLVERLRSYATSYVGGIVFDVGREITTERGYAADYASLDYRNTTQRRQMGSLVDAFIKNVSDETKAVRRQISLCEPVFGYCTYQNIEDFFDYVAIIGDDEVVPFYRRVDPTGRENGRVSVLGCNKSEGYVDYDMECGEGFQAADARGNPTLSDSDEGGYIMSDLPYATFSADDPDAVDRVEPDVALGRVFADGPHHLIRMIDNYESQITVDEAVMLVNGENMFRDEAANILAPTLRNYLSEGNIRTVIRWLPNGAVSYINSTPLSFLLTHANHLKFADASSTSNLDASVFTDMSWVGPRLLLSDGCHSGYTISHDTTTNLSTLRYDAYGDALARILMHQGVALIAPRTYGLGNDDGVPEVHELLLDKLSRNVFLKDTVGKMWMYSLKDYAEHVGRLFWSDDDTYTLYSMGLYGLPTQPLNGVRSVGATAPSEERRVSQLSGASSIGLRYSRENVRVDVKVSGNSTMEVTVDVPKFYNESVGGATILKILGGTTTYQSGGPILPMIMVSRLLPKGSNVTSVSLKEANVSEVLNNVSLLNATIIARSTQVATNTSPNISEPYPETLLSFNTTDWEEGLLLYINVIPLQYNVSSRKVVLYNHLKFNVGYLTPNKTSGDPLLSQVSLNTTNLAPGGIIGVNVSISSPAVKNATLTHSLTDETGATLLSDTLPLNLSNGSNIISFTVNTTGFNPGVKTLSTTLSISGVGIIESHTTEFRINGIFVDLTSPKTELTSADDRILVNVTVRDEGGNHVTGLPNQNFTVKLDGNTTAVNLTEVSPGVYQTSINTTGLSDGQYSLLIYVHDPRGITEYDQLTLILTSTETQTLNLTTGWNLISLPLNL